LVRALFVYLARQKERAARWPRAPLDLHQARILADIVEGNEGAALGPAALAGGAGDPARPGQPVTAAVLAREFAVSERTIYRDMVALQAIGAPVLGEAGLGYQLEDGFFLPPLRSALQTFAAAYWQFLQEWPQPNASVPSFFAGAGAGNKSCSFFAGGWALGLTDDPFLARSRTCLGWPSLPLPMWSRFLPG
jgi:biotin operon repressor